MAPDFWTVVAIAAAAGIASPAGGLIAIWTAPSTLFMSGALGFAAGVLLGTIGFEMMPNALEHSSLALAITGFVAGFAAVYAFDLVVHRGTLVGAKADQRRWVKPTGRQASSDDGEVTVLAGGTSAEELIEGITIGVGLAIKPGLGLVVALAIVIDNVSEALSIGEIIRQEKRSGGASEARRILQWTGLIGGSVFVSSLAGRFFLRGLSPSALGFLFGAGAGAMFYLTVTDLIPQAEERQYQQIAAIAMGVGFMLMFGLGSVL